ncbi:hypothetical protein [Nocardioides plantarum]|uniref:EamA-like transporter family protein n=1 Tax=Nocardioides plantarum TaxID=29299 RepID=A0ABV5KF26_9ACTN|nr:hypothetical protein [Nocardioides plantarum]
MSSLDPTAPTPRDPAPDRGPLLTLRRPEVRRDSVAVALGVAFLAAAVVVSGTRARSGPSGDLDLTVFLVGVAATVVLLGFGVLARASVADRVTAHALMSWPLAFGTVGAGLMLGILLDDGTSTTYIAGALVIALAAASYLLVPSAPPVVAGIFGVLLVYGQAFTDVVDFDVVEDNGFKTFAFAVFLFVAIVTAIGWVLPPARTVVPVVVGVGAVVAYAGLMAAIAVTAIFVGGFAELDESGETPEPPSYDGDVYTLFAFAAVLVVGWLVLGYLTDATGYRVIIVAMVATVFPAGISLLAVEHPTVWGVVVAVLGTLVLAVVGARAASHRSTGSATPTGPTGPTGPPPSTPPPGPYAG